MSGFGHYPCITGFSFSSLGARWLRDQCVLPPTQVGTAMADQYLDYRLWHHGIVWRWQVLCGWDVLGSGMEATSAEARIAALRLCQRLQTDKKE